VGEGWILEQQIATKWQINCEGNQRRKCVYFGGIIVNKARGKQRKNEIQEETLDSNKSM
jgi:hypothetical protein